MYYSAIKATVFREMNLFKIPNDFTLPPNWVWAPTDERGADVDGEARQRGRLRVVGEQKGVEAESLRHAGQDAHAGGTDVIALFHFLLGICHLIHRTGLLRLIPDMVQRRFNIT